MGYNLSPQFSETMVRRFTVRGGRPGMQLDRFIQVCTQLQTMTQVFRERDTAMTGNIRLSYEDFLSGAVTRLMWASSPWLSPLHCGFIVSIHLQVSLHVQVSFHVQVKCVFSFWCSLISAPACWHACSTSACLLLSVLKPYTKQCNEPRPFLDRWLLLPGLSLMASYHQSVTTAGHLNSRNPTIDALLTVSKCFLNWYQHRT